MPESAIDELKEYGHIVCHPDGNQLRILSPFGHAAFDLPRCMVHDCNSAQVVELSDSIFARTRELELKEVNQPLRVSISVCYEAVLDVRFDAALEQLMKLIPFPCIICVDLHFTQSSIDCSRVISIAAQCKAIAGKQRKIVLGLVGPLCTSIVDYSLELFRAGVALRHVPAAQSMLGCLYPSLQDTTQSLEALAQFGFHIPIVWYASATNLGAADKAIDELLEVTYYAGLAVPLVSSNPYYTFSSTDPELPASSSYCEFLTSIYSRCRHYDSELAPINELALLSTLGGIHRTSGMPSFLKFFVSASGSVGLFRQTPARSVHWLTIESLAAIEANEAWRSLGIFIQSIFRWERNAFCSDCQWRNVCGGIDFFDDSVSISNETLELMCDHRLLFLEHFACSRAADFDLLATGSFEV